MRKIRREHAELEPLRPLVTALDDGSVNMTVPVKVYQPTLGLRWSSQGVLQQAWQETRTGEIDWCDVPHEEVTNDKS